MTGTWKRWQDWATVIVGVLLFIVPFAFSMSGTTAAWTAYVGGVLLVVVGLWSLSSPATQSTEWAAVVIGVLLVIAPFVLGFTGVMPLAYSAWIAGILAIVLSGWVLLGDRVRGELATPVHS